MDVKLFNYRSQRAHQARYGHALQPWVIVLQVLTVCMALLGIAFLFIQSPLAWVLIGLAAMPAMVAEWYQRELKNVPVIKGGQRIDDLLDSELLGMLPAQPTPQQIAMAVARTNGGVFFAARFGVGGGFMEQLVSKDREDTAVVFSEALRIAGQVGGRITAGVLILALVRQLPAKDTLLGHLQLNEDDILRGINWHHRLQDMVAQGRRRRSGGIGRDWSFGWIPRLSRYGQNISEQRTPLTEVRSEVVGQLQGLIEKGRGSIALVGQNGVGKTQIVHELASRLMDTSAKVPHVLQYHQVFMLDASRLLSAASSPGQIEVLVDSLLGEAFAAKNIILCLDNAQLFFEEGVGSVDISTLLLPILEAGRLPIILSMDEQRYLQISKRLPALNGAVQRVNVAPLNEADTLKVLEHKLPYIEYAHKVTYMYQALKVAYSLSARYVYDISMPGQAVSLLEAAVEYAEDGLVTARSVQKAVEQTVGVKTAAVDDETERETLLNMEKLIHERMIGQDRAVGVVSDALRRARSGVRNQDRPVGTFLFLGPTGVGKTELAKSLAAVYFGGEENIIRLDMNEFVSAKDVDRLIADGTEDAQSLTAQVMKRPFSVVLLDEIEKAHSSVLSTLLQLLDEGILRDTRNREVSFKDTIVLATSNAGAARIQEFLHRGYALEEFEDQFVDELISSNLFHPEFLNRFDEMVVFRPLQKDELLQVVDLILVAVNKNLASQKITVTVAEDAKAYLVEAGYDPRLGARPMRRVVQRAVENTVAKQLLAKEVQPGGVVEISREQVESIIQTKQKADRIQDGSTD